MRIGMLFVAGEGTNEVADVSVIEASDHIWSCPCAHRCVLTAINVTESRRTPTAVLLLARPFPVESLNASAISPMAVLSEAVDYWKKRGLAKSVVAESVSVT